MPTAKPCVQTSLHWSAACLHVFVQAVFAAVQDTLQFFRAQSEESDISGP